MSDDNRPLEEETQEPEVTPAKTTSGQDESPGPPIQRMVIVAAALTITPLLAFLVGCVVIFGILCVNASAVSDSPYAILTFIFPVPILALVLLETNAVKKRSIPCSLAIGAFSMIIAIGLGLFLYDPAILFPPETAAEGLPAKSPHAPPPGGVGLCIGLFIYFLFVGLAHLRWWRYLSILSQRSHPE